MNLNKENNLLNNKKDNKITKQFIKELSSYLNNLELKKQNSLYQVIQITKTGAYLENLKNHKVIEEKNLPKELYNQISNDSIVRYKDGSYIYEEELTDRFLNNLIEINEYQKIYDDFFSKNDLSNNPLNTIYTIKSINGNNYILSYKKYDYEKILEVPKELLPYYSKIGDKLYYKNIGFYIK